MKRLLLLTAIFCSTTVCYAQSDFRNGYIITSSRDTLLGLIDYREGDKAYKVCDFKSSKDQPETTYTPTDIIGYGFVNDKFFASREISMKDQPKQVVFIEVIVRGSISLFKFEETFFVEKNDTSFYELIAETKDTYVNETRVLQVNRKYMGILNMLLFDCPEMRRKSEKVRLSEKDLTKLIEEYNRCNGASSISFKEKKPWIKAIPGVSVGVNISGLKFEQPPEYMEGAFETSSLPMFGISVDVLAPRISERISFHAGLYYSPSKYYNYSVVTTGSSVTRNYVTLEVQPLKIPIGFRYTFPLRNFTPYLTVGGSGTLHVSSQANLTQEIATKTGSTYEVETFKYQADLSDYQLGVWGGLGLLKSISNKLNAFTEIRYEQTNGISGEFSNPFDRGSTISNVQLILGIRIK